MDGQKTQIVPCGKCYKCLNDRKNSWTFRLQQEAKNSISASFTTLTYSDSPLSFNGHQTLEPTDLQKFFKRLRKHINYHYPNTTPLKYMAVGEYGTKLLRPHYHAIIFNIPPQLLHKQIQLPLIWGKGLTETTHATTARMGYTMGYISNGKWQPTRDDDDRQPEFQRQSHNIGKSYLTPQMVNYHKSHMLPIITKQGGIIQKMPKYYKEKIFNKQERDIMAKQSQKIAELPLSEWIDYDYSQEHERLIAAIRTDTKRKKLNSKSNM